MCIKNNHYKEVPPKKTINSLKAILLAAGVELNEEWLPQSTAGTFSVRVTLPNSSIGTNGKGMTKDYALASAYAEFFERFQNRILGLSNPNRFSEVGYYRVHDERDMSISDVCLYGGAFIRYLIRSLGLQDVCSDERLKQLEKLFSLRKNNKTKKYTTYPFYNVNADRLEYLPISISLPFYGSNGMSAGNSPEEALVQAFSEIFERFVQKEVISKKLALPDVPESYLQKFANLYKIYCKMNSIENYKLYIKDCSLGGKYPVVAIVIIEIDSGKYGIHFGAHPDFGIALERAFTEASQGQDILKFAHNCDFDFYNHRVFESSNYYNIFDIARGKYPCEFFFKESKYKFCVCDRFKADTNSGMLKAIIDGLKQDGYEVLVRDSSTLGFPSYHVIVPGMSELSNFSVLDAKIYNTRLYVKELLKNPGDINSTNVQLVKTIIEYYRHYYAYTNIAAIFQLHSSEIISENLDLIFILLLSAIYQNDVSAALKCANVLLSSTKLLDIQKKTWIHVILEYYKGIHAGYSDEQIFKCLYVLYNRDAVNEVKRMVSNPQSVFMFYLHMKELEDTQQLKLSKYLDQREVAQDINQLNLRGLFSS